MIQSKLTENLEEYECPLTRIILLVSLARQPATECLINWMIKEYLMYPSLVSKGVGGVLIFEVVSTDLNLDKKIIQEEIPALKPTIFI